MIHQYVLTNFLMNTNKGMTPIAKNITVQDRAGKPLAPTYAKRAKQLVKKERAKWINGSAIQLAGIYSGVSLLGSSYYKSEEDIMSDNANLKENLLNKDLLKNETEAFAQENAMNNISNSNPGNEFLRLLNKIADESVIASKALDMLSSISSEEYKVESIKSIVGLYEETRQTVVKEISRIMAISTANNGANVAGRLERGGTDKKILEYYLTHGGEESIGFPDDRAGSVYVTHLMGGNKQDFNGGEAGRCLLMSSGNGAFLLKDPFHDGYWTGNNRNTLNFPISDQYQNGSVIQQDFHGGFMTYDPEDNEVSIYFKSKK